MNFACDADRVAWGTWRELAGPTSPIKRPAEAKVVLRKAVAGDANTPRTVVGPVITRLSRLFASLINAIPGVPRDAAEHARKVSPESVEKIRAREGGGGMFSAKEKACWEIYTRLFAANLGEEQIMAVVKKTIGDRVRRDMENSGT